MSKLDFDLELCKKLALLIQMTFLNVRRRKILSVNMKKQYPLLLARALIRLMSLLRRLEGNKVIIYSVE